MLCLILSPIDFACDLAYTDPFVAIRVAIAPLSRVDLSIREPATPPLSPRVTSVLRLVLEPDRDAASAGN